MTLPSNTVFLPVLDDLLSPDLRPVLQTPTADVTLLAIGGRTLGLVSGSNATSKPTTNGTMSPEDEENIASRRIQKWWRIQQQRRHSSEVDIRAERAKHSIRHGRTDEHILFLEKEVYRLKSALTAERKLRSLQMDAIRSLWSQVQKMSPSVNPGDGTSVMTQSMPNGLLASSSPRKIGGKSDGMSVSYCGPIQPEYGDHSHDLCGGHCSKEIQLLRQSMSQEISQLRAMITSLKIQEVVPITGDQSCDKVMPGTSVMALGSFESAKDSMEVDLYAGITKGRTYFSPQAGPQRPGSLSITGLPVVGEQSNPDEIQEITEFAGNMAKNLLANPSEKIEASASTVN